MLPVITNQWFLRSKPVEKNESGGVCTTDEPSDSLKYHQQLDKQSALKVLPTFRPDKFLEVGHADYLQTLKSWKRQPT